MLSETGYTARSIWQSEFQLSVLEGGGFIVRKSGLVVGNQCSVAVKTAGLGSGRPSLFINLLKHLYPAFPCC